MGMYTNGHDEVLKLETETKWSSEIQSVYTGKKWSRMVVLCSKQKGDRRNKEKEAHNKTRWGRVERAMAKGQSSLKEENTTR